MLITRTTLMRACGAGLVLLASQHAVSAAAAADPAALMGEYDRAVRQVEAQDETIVRAADTLAAAVVDGAALAVAGSTPVRLDAMNRPGAMLATHAAPGAGDAVVYVLEDSAPAVAGTERIEALAAAGSTVVVLAAWDADVADTLRGRVHAAASAVIEIESGASLRPALTLTAFWALQAELFAACTRLGETPIVQRCETLDPAGRRAWRYGERRFHHDLWLDPIPPGRAARAYLDHARTLALDLRTVSGDALDEAAWRCGIAARDGGTVWLTAGARLVFASRYLPGGPTGVMRPWSWNPRTGAGPAAVDDVVIAVGGVDPPSWTWWREIDAMRDAGLGVVWVQPGHFVDRDRLAARDVLLDTQTPFGDACVKAAGYDTRLGPLSSLATELVLACLAEATAAGQATSVYSAPR